MSSQCPGWGTPGTYQRYPAGPKPTKRSDWLSVVAGVAVLAVGVAVGGGVLAGRRRVELGRPGGPADEPGPAGVVLPRPDSFGYSDGPESMCAALDEVMSARGYLPISGEETNRGLYCRFITRACHC